MKPESLAEKIFEEIKKGARKLVEESGERMVMNSPYCEEYKVKHPGCEDCEFGLGCMKYTALVTIQAQTFVTVCKGNVNGIMGMLAVSMFMADILGAKTEEELKEVITRDFE